jgi:hypothetical protein
MHTLASFFYTLASLISLVSLFIHIRLVTYTHQQSDLVSLKRLANAGGHQPKMMRTVCPGFSLWIRWVSGLSNPKDRQHYLQAMEVAAMSIRRQNRMAS